MDRVYKDDLPALIEALAGLRREFKGLTPRTDWARLRIAPLLQHARALQRVVDAPQFSRETSRLARGVVMFRSDLVYLRENVKALRAVLEVERKAGTPRKPRSARSGGRPARA